MPLIPKAKRFAPRAKIHVVYLPSVAAVNALGLPEPTAAEINAGTFLTREVVSIDGFSTKTNYAQTGDAGTFFMGKVPVSAEADDAAITFNADEAGVDASTIFSRGQRGYILIATGGVEEDYKAEVHEVIVGSVARLKALDDSVKVRVDFAVPSEPNEDFAIPAAIVVPAA